MMEWWLQKDSLFFGYSATTTVQLEQKTEQGEKK